MDISFQTVDKTLLVSTPEAKRREMGNLVHHFQTEEPSVCDIDFDFRYWMNGILMSMIIDKTPVDCLVNQAQQIVSS